MKKLSGLFSILVLSIFTSAYIKDKQQTQNEQQGKIMQAGTETGRIPTILNTVSGDNDALAIFLAVNYREIDLKAITVATGNVTLKQGIDNALKIVSLAKQCNIPVSASDKNPLTQKLVIAEFFHGQNGL